MIFRSSKEWQSQEVHDQAKMVSSSSSHDLPQKCLQIKEEDKFFSRLLSKENSSSFRVLYYGGASGAIPFRWESSPGTPKHTFSDHSLPPLTPPPSYHINSKGKSMQKHSKQYNLLYTIFPRLAPRKTHESPLSSLSSMTSSSSLGSRTSRSPLQYEIDDDEQAAFESPTSTLCGFGVKHKTSNGFRGCFPWRT